MKTIEEMIAKELVTLVYNKLAYTMAICGVNPVDDIYKTDNTTSLVLETMGSLDSILDTFQSKVLRVCGIQHYMPNTGPMGIPVGHYYHDYSQRICRAMETIETALDIYRNSKQHKDRMHPKRNTKRNNRSRPEGEKPC